MNGIKFKHEKKRVNCVRGGVEEEPETERAAKRKRRRNDRDS